MKLTTDIIVGTGLVAALILNIILGGDTQITMNLSTGLVGFIGKSVLTSARTKPQEPAKKEEPQNETSNA